MSVDEADRLEISKVISRRAEARTPYRLARYSMKTMYAPDTIVKAHEISMEVSEYYRNKSIRECSMIETRDETFIVPVDLMEYSVFTDYFIRRIPESDLTNNSFGILYEL